MPHTSSILIVGATGLVGRSVVRQADARQPMTLLVRHSSLAASASPFPRERVAAIDAWPSIVEEVDPEIVINCLGTTMKQAGSESAFRAIDHDLVLDVARAAHVAGTRHVISMSSVGAAADSHNFYLRTKGETENALRALGFARLDFIRPGLLKGDRSEAGRSGSETLAVRLAPLMDALLFGPFRRYRSIPAETVARAILRLVAQGGVGAHVHENDSLHALA